MTDIHQFRDNVSQGSFNLGTRGSRTFIREKGDGGRGTGEGELEKGRQEKGDGRRETGEGEWVKGDGRKGDRISET
jgi:hypothetical protein